MRYIDYSWDLEPERILFDEELDIENLGWKPGDLFKVEVTEDGRKVLRKVSVLEQFVRGYKVNE